MTNNDRQAVASFHRAERFKSDTGTEGRLAEIERAAMAFRDKVLAEKNDLKEKGMLTDSAISIQIAQRAHQWLAERTTFEAMLKEITQGIPRTPPGLPERTEAHREISAHFKTLKGDLRQEAITRAITGKDAPLAEALATEPPSTSTLMEFDRKMIIERIQPESVTQENARTADIQSRINATRATLAEVTTTISGAT